MIFKKATKAAAKLRLAIIGPAGGGKTYTALALAQGLGHRIAVIDTEHGSASKYADKFEFDVLELESFEPKTYVDALAAAVAEGYGVVIIDSLSHAWMGKNGALEQVDRKAAAGGRGNSFDAWRSVTPQHNSLVEAMLRCDAHLLVTMRTKTEYVIEEDSRGKKSPRKVGLAPVQRDGLEYEFDVVLDVNADHVATVSKTRCSAIADQAFDRPGLELSRVLKGWLSDGPLPAPPAPSTSPALAGLLAEIRGAQGPGDVAALWRGTVEVRSTLPPAELRAAWTAAVAAAAALGTDEEGLKAALRPPVAPAAAPVGPTPGPLDAFNAALGDIQRPGEGVAVWLRFRAELAPLDPAVKEEAWKALCMRVEHVGKMANAKVWLKKAIAEEDARRGPPGPEDEPPPAGPGSPRSTGSIPGPRHGGDAAGPASTPAEGSVAALAAHLAAKPHVVDPQDRTGRDREHATIATSYLKRAPDLAALGRGDEALDTVRAELRRRGCLEPDAMLAGVAKRLGWRRAA